MAKIYQFKRSKGLFQADSLAGVTTEDIAKKSELLTDGKIKTELLPPSSGGTEFVEYDDTVAKNRFISEMNKKAVSIGMNNTVYVEPAGFPSTLAHKSTARDMAKLCLIATTYRELTLIDKQPSRAFTVKGENPRNLTISNIFEGIPDYHIFFSKTGSIIGGGVEMMNGAHIVVITDAPNNMQYVASILGSPSITSRNEDLKKALDNATGLALNTLYVTEELSAIGAFVAIVPLGSVNTYAHNYDLPIAFGKGVDTQYHMASTTKVMTAILGLDYIKNLDTKITVKATDIKAGTGAVFQAGDVLDFRDALYNMMLTSSNTISHAVARTVGNMILNYES